MPRLVIGNVPNGPEYFGQEKVLAELREALHQDHVLLAGPRRFGKTGAMYALLDNPPDGYSPVYINVEDITNPSDFMVELIAALASDKTFRRLFMHGQDWATAAWSFLRSLPAEIGIGELKITLRESQALKNQWDKQGELALSLMSGSSPALLLILDEFPIMIDAIAAKKPDEARQLMHWLRKSLLDKKTGTRFLIGGSIHLEPTLEALGLVDTINHLNKIEIPVFSRPVAEAFILDVFKTYAIKAHPQAPSAILNLVGAPIPYLLAVFLDAIKTEHKFGGKAEVTPEILGGLFEDSLIQGKTSATFRHYQDRINQYYPYPLDMAAFILLESMAQTEDGFSENGLFQIYLKKLGLSGSYQDKQNFLILLSRLENDVYVHREEGRCRFFSRVLRLWWLRNCCLGPEA
jgi:hypothetical protein